MAPAVIGIAQKVPRFPLINGTSLLHNTLVFKYFFGNDVLIFLAKGSLHVLSKFVILNNNGFFLLAVN